MPSTEVRSVPPQNHQQSIVPDNGLTLDPQATLPRSGLEQHRMTLGKTTLAVAGMIACQATSINAAEGVFHVMWDHSITPTVSGYVVYFGNRPGNWSLAVDAGYTNQIWVKGFRLEEEYFITARAYIPSGEMSSEATERVSAYPHISASAANYLLAKDLSALTLHTNIPPSKPVEPTKEPPFIPGTPCTIQEFERFPDGSTTITFTGNGLVELQSSQDLVNWSPITSGWVKEGVPAKLSDTREPDTRKWLYDRQNYEATYRQQLKQFLERRSSRPPAPDERDFEPDPFYSPYTPDYSLFDFSAVRDIDPSTPGYASNVGDGWRYATVRPRMHDHYRILSLPIPADYKF